MKLRYDYFMSMLCCLGMMFFTTANLNAQECTCQNTTPFGTITAPTFGGIESGITTCAFTTEYSTINSAVAGTTYQVTGTKDVGAIPMWLTVRTGAPGGAVLACGLSPLTFTATASETVYLHYNQTSACNTEGGCVNATITCTSCPALEAPANNNCASAVTLTPESAEACVNTVAGTTLGATNSMETAPSCSDDGLAGGDVWYQFVASSEVHRLTFSSVTSALGFASTMAAAVYQGSCGGLIQVPGSCGFSNVSRNIGNLVVGQTYFIRVWTVSTASGQANNFNICLGTPSAAPPANNLCTSSVPLAVNPDLECASYTPGTTMNAYNSGETDPSCVPNGLFGGDVWYSFVATSEVHHILLNNITGTGGTSNLVTAVYEGACGNLTQVSSICQSGGATVTTRVASGLTPGVIYFVRVWTTSTLITQSNSFEICIGTPPPPPPNNHCIGATVLAVNPSDECMEVTAGTTLSSSNSGETEPSCNVGGLDGGDVWYQFTATGEAHYIIISNIQNEIGTGLFMVTAVYQGGCGALTQISGACTSAGAGTRIASGLTPGNTYYVRVWTSSISPSQANSFNICIGTPPPPPPNNHCIAAINLSVSSTSDCSQSTPGTTEFSTNSMDGDPGCNPGGLAGGDVWFSFTASNDAHQILLSDVVTESGLASNLVTSVYSGSCGELVNIYCSSTGLERSLFGLTPGQTYYIRVWTVSATATQANSFNICVVTLVLSPGDVCTDPLIVDNLTYTFTGNTSDFGNFHSAADRPDLPASQPAPSQGTGSASYLNGPEVVFLYTPTANTTINVSLTAVEDGWISLWMFTGCPFNSIVSFQTATSGNARLLPDIDVLAGVNYYIVVSGWGTTPPSYNFTLVITENTCDAPVISSEIVEDCDEGTYSVLFTMETPGSNVGAYGGSATVGGETFVTENALANTVGATFLAGPFPIGTAASVSVIAEDANCSGPLGTFNFAPENCPCPAGSVTAGLFPGDVCTPSNPMADLYVVSENCECIPFPGCLTFNTWSPFPEDTFTPICDNTTQEITPFAWANEYSNINVIEGNTYTFSTSVPDVITISDNNGVQIFAVGLQTATWTATYTGVVRFFNHLDTDCGAQSTSRTKSVVCELPIPPFDCPILEADNGDPCDIDGAAGILIDCECAVFDCNDVAGGTAFVDECGDCVGGDTGLDACEADCDGVFGGTAFIDECGDCVGGDTGLDACEQDCDGVFGGTAFIDDCGDCVGGDTGLDACVEDCDGVFGGTAFIDECGDCVGGDTGMDACVQDCDGVFGGTAFIDECGDCVGGDTGLDACEQDCAGVFGGTSEIDDCGVCLLDGDANPDWNASCADCAGVPNGPGDIDECGVCIADGPTSSTWNATCTDCAGVVNGTAFVDNCGDCVGGTTGLDECEADCFGVLGGEGIFDDCGVCRLPGDPDFNSTCTDCAGVVNGTAVVDECGDCVGGTTGEVACAADCAGVFGGTAFLDDCGDCVGGTTGVDACVQDCAGVFGGTAFIDDCGDCVGGTTGLNACAEDCAGVFGGSAFVDECGDCVGGTTGLDACVQDCAGVFGGDAEIDACGVCVTGGSSSPNWNASCTDCAGVVNGNAFLDNCGDCVGGTTGLNPCAADCLGVPGGSAEVDACGVCYANGPANPNWNSTCTDCAGVVNGTAFVDNCGDCVGGTTGQSACVADCLGVPGGSAEVDACGDCWANGSANPSWNLACTDCAGVVNGTSQIDPCGDCILNGPSNPLWGAACAGENFNLSGTITTVNGNPVPAATASLAAYSATTNAAGMYNLVALEGTSGTLTAMKDVNPRNGISTFDLVLIQRHILGIEYFTSPYQKVAADANKNNMLEVGDILMIQQLLLYNVNDFLDPFTGAKVNTSWRMIKPGLTDPNPNSAVVPPVQNGYAISNLAGNQTGLDFVAVKIGDVNSSANPNNMEPGNFDQSLNWRSPWFWTTDDQFVQKGETYEIQIAGMNDEAFNGFQAALHTQGLEIIRIDGNNLNGWNANNHNILHHDLALISWFSSGAAQQRGEVIFTITAEATASGKLSEMISLEHELLATEAYAFDHSHAPVQLVFNEIQGETATRLSGSFPNPFNVETTIGFFTDADQTFEISIYDMHGKRVHFDVINSTVGYNEWTWKPTAAVHAGFFIFKLQNDTEVLQGKLIFID